MIPPLLRRPGPFRALWAANTISLLGDQVTLLAVPLLAVLQLHAGPAQMGLLTAVAWLPFLLFSIPLGSWVDRRGRRRQLMVAADLGRAAVLLTIPAAALAGRTSLPQLYAVTFAAGCFSVLAGVCSQAVFVALVGRDDYVQGSSLLNGGRAFSFLAGRALAGVLIQLLSAAGAVLADALTFLGSGLWLATIRTPEPPAAEPERRAILGGLQFIRGDRLIRDGLLATAWINLFNLAYNALVILFIAAHLQVAPAALGLVLSASAVGSLAGSAAAGRIARSLGSGPALIVGCFLFTAPLVLVPLAAGPMPAVLALLFASNLLAGFGVMVLDINANTIYAARIPDRLRSRVSGAYTAINYGVRPLGSLLGGAVASAIGVRDALLLFAVAAVFGGLLLVPSPIRALHQLPEAAG